MVKFLLHLTILLVFIVGKPAYSQSFRYQLASGNNQGIEKAVVGFMQSHTVDHDETLLDIAREYGLGFNEIALLYPSIDPWLPEPGLEVSIPTRWILPRNRHEEIVVNLPELRLYRFFSKVGMVKTYPVGIGTAGWETPLGVYRVVSSEKDPVWTVPSSLREKRGIGSVPPGPRNPLGDHWLGLSIKGYGIHGTNFPWGVGRLVSHGCIRMYPEHISRLKEEVSVGTTVEIIYEPVKFGTDGTRWYIEVHPDTYKRVPDMEVFAKSRLEELGLMGRVSMESVRKALKSQNGVPTLLDMIAKGGDSQEFRPSRVASHGETHITHNRKGGKNNEEVRQDDFFDGAAGLP